MNVGDRVTTPHGPATIIEVRGDTEWIFHRAHRRPLVIVRYPGGNVQAWVPAKVKPIMQATIGEEYEPPSEDLGEQDPEHADEKPNPDQTQLPEPEQQPQEDQPEPDQDNGDDDTEDE